MIYYSPDDPELGYFSDDEVVPCGAWGATGCGSRDCTGWAVVSYEDRISHHVEEADCSICQGQIPSDATLPLCRTCEATAKAHAKYSVEAMRYPDPEIRR